MLTLNNPEDLYIFKLNNRGDYLIKDPELTKIFISDLKEVHTILSKNPDLSLKAGIDTLKGFFNRRKCGDIIGAFGEEQFRAASWDDIVKTIFLYRKVIKGEEISEEEVAGNIPSDEIEILPDEAPDDEGIAEEPITPEPEEKVSIQGITEEQVRKLSEYINKKYPDAHAVQNNVRVIINNIIEDYKIINKEGLSGEQYEELSDQILESFAALDQYHEMALAPDKFTEDVAPEQEEGLEEENITLVRDKYNRPQYPATLNVNEAIELAKFPIHEYVTIQDNNIIIDQAGFKSAYVHAKGLFTNWTKNLIQKYPNNNYFKKPSGNKIKELNNIAFSIRAFDIGIYQKYLDFLEELDRKITSAVEKESVQGLIELRKNLIKQEGTILIPNLLSSYFKSDMAFAESMALYLLYVSSYVAFTNVEFAREKFIDRPGKLSPKITNNEEAIAYFTNQIRAFSYQNTATKFLSFWRLDRQEALNPDKYTDLVSFLNISAKEFFTGAINKTINHIDDKKTFFMTNCPTCHRVINWSNDKGVSREQDFNVGLFAPYRKFDKNYGRDFGITEDSLRYDENGKALYYEKPGDDYIKVAKVNKETFDFINEMGSNAYTWDEVNALINSSTYKEQVEGYLRRSEILRLAGAAYIATKNLNRLKSFCPIEKTLTDGGTNVCGLAYDEPKGDRPYNLQPVWNGASPSLVTTPFGKHKTYNFNKFEPVGWENQSLAEIAKSKTSGGYKFSKTVFGCPCHIDEYSEDSNIHNKFNNLAFALTKDKLYHPPTSPSGESKNIDPQTIAYVVCGANVSLSSVDRDSESTNNIVNYLSGLSTNNIEQFFALVDFLVRNGFDETELIQMIEDISSKKAPSANITKRTERINYLQELIVKNAATIALDTPIYHALKNLTLVCPFGHKFTIGQSLGFGETHSSIRLKSSKDAKAITDIAVSAGESNLKLFSRYLVTTAVFTSARKFLYYDEWIKQPEEKRRLNSYLQKYKEEDKYFLKFKINNEDMAFSDGVAVRQDILWGNDRSRFVDVDQAQGEANNTSSVFYTSSLEGGRDGDSGSLKRDNLKQTEIDLVHEKEEDLGEWDRTMKDIMDLSEYSPPIPGGVAVYEEGKTLGLIKNMNALNRALASALNIINTWCTNLIDEKFSESLTRQILEDDKIEKISSKIFDIFIAPALISFEIYDEERQEELTAQATKEYKNLFNSIFVDNTQINTLIREGKLTEQAAAKKIISDSINEFISKFDNITLPDEISTEIKEVNVEPIVSQILTSTELEIKNPGIRKNVSLEEQITLFDSDTKFKERGLGKLVLIAYSRFLASALYKMQLTFFLKNSPLYIGYQPIPIVFSSLEEILQISKDDILSIETNYTLNSIIDSPNTIYNDRIDVEELAENYVMMINKAYQFLDTYVNNARNLIINPVALNSAKKYVIEKLGEQYLAEYIKDNPDIDIKEAEESLSLQKKRFSETFNVISAKYTDLIGSDGMKYNPISFLPNLTKSRTSITADHSFYDNVVAVKNPDTNEIYLVNENHNYDNSKSQIGTFSEPTLRQWPLNKTGYQTPAKSINHVGVPVPLYEAGNYKGQFSDLRDLGIVSMNIIANIPYKIGETSTGLKLDVSFLLERGYSPEHYRMIYNLQFDLQEIKRIFKEETKKFNEVKITHPNLIEDLSAQINDKQSLIRRLKLRSNRDNDRRAIVEGKRLNALLVSMKQLEYELDNIVELKANLQKWYDNSISKLQEDYNSLPYSISTVKGRYYMPHSAVQTIPEGTAISAYKKVITANASMPHVGLADPVTAYFLIKNQELHGTSYSNLGDESIPTEQIQDALINFIVQVYGLDEIVKQMLKNKKLVKRLAELKIDTERFNGRELLEYTINNKLEDISFIYEEDILPGTWFDIDQERSSISIQASEHIKDVKQVFPSMTQLKNFLSKQKEYGILRPRKDEDSVIEIKSISNRAATQMRKYITNMTRGNLPDDNVTKKEVLEKMKESSKYLDKIIKRGKMLWRIMLEQGAEELSPNLILRP